MIKDENLTIPIMALPANQNVHVEPVRPLPTYSAREFDAQKQIAILTNALEVIHRRAKETYKMRPYHDEEISFMGMVAENALINAGEI